MKRLLGSAVAALLGALAGSAIRQLVVRRVADGEAKEIVIAANPVPLVAGTVAGFVLPRYRTFVAFVVAANVAANTKTGIEAS